MKTKIFVLCTALTSSFNVIAYSHEPDYKALGHAYGMAKFISHTLCPKVETPLTNQVIERLDGMKSTLSPTKRALIEVKYANEGRKKMETALKRLSKRSGASPDQFYNDEGLCYTVDDSMQESLMLLDFQGFY